MTTQTEKEEAQTRASCQSVDDNVVSGENVDKSIAVIKIAPKKLPMPAVILK